MCKLCNFTTCPTKCPNYHAPTIPSRVLRCILCGDRIDFEKGYFTRNGFPYCFSCLKYADTESFIRICETSLQNLLENLGFVYCRTN